MLCEKDQQDRDDRLRADALAIGHANKLCINCEKLATCSHLLSYVRSAHKDIYPLFAPCSEVFYRRGYERPYIQPELPLRQKSYA